MSERDRGMTRRKVGKLLLAAPAAAWAIPTWGAEDKPSDTAEFLSAHEPGLSPEERERLKKGFADQEKALKLIRDFVVPNDVGPSLRFEALPSRRG